MQWFLKITLATKHYTPEVTYSFVPESKVRDSRFKFGLEDKAWKESKSVLEPKLRYSKSRNRNWKLNHWDCSNISATFSNMVFLLQKSFLVLELESKYQDLQFRNRNQSWKSELSHSNVQSWSWTRNRVQYIDSLRNGFGARFQCQEKESEF